MTNNDRQSGTLAGAFTVTNVIYVSPSGNDANDGLTWATAKRTVQAGLNAAAAGDQVWVAAGTYVENITLKSGVALYGGFAGTETDLSGRNWAANRDDPGRQPGRQRGDGAARGDGWYPDRRVHDPQRSGYCRRLAWRWDLPG